MAKKHVVPDLSPGPLPGTPISWRCWKLEGAPERIEEWRRVGEFIEVEAQTAVVAKAKACSVFRCDPIRVDVEPGIQKQGQQRRIITDGLMTPAEREEWEAFNEPTDDLTPEDLEHVERAHGRVMKHVGLNDEEFFAEIARQKNDRIKKQEEQHANGKSRLGTALDQLRDYFKR